MPGQPLISEDLSELISILNSHQIEFMVVGAHALGQYTEPRFTSDLDLFLRKTEENMQRLADALAEFGMPIDRESLKGMIEKDRAMIIIGAPPNRVDFLNFLTGLDFDDAYPRTEIRSIGSTKAPFISKQDLITAKRAVGRPKDLADLAALMETEDKK